MAVIHAALGQPSSAQGTSFSPLALGIVPGENESHGIEPSSRMIAEHSHAPPATCSPSARPLRI
jgi:hypothetical protein